MEKILYHVFHLVLMAGLLSIIGKPFERKEAIDMAPAETVTATINSSKLTAKAIETTIEPSEPTNEPSEPTKGNVGWTLGWIVVAIICMSFTIELWGATKVEKAKTYKSPWKRITSHFVAARKVTNTDEDGREYEETEILNTKTAKPVWEGREELFDEVDKANILKYLEKDEDSLLNIHACETAKYWWARGEGTDRIYARGIGFGKTYVRACVTCYNARYLKE